MGATPRSRALPWLAVLLAAALLVVALLWSRAGSAPDNAPEEPPAPVATRPDRPPAPPPPSSPPLAPPPAPVTALVPPDAGPAPEPEADAPREHPVNLAKLREQLPDNLYWELGVPTTDPELLRRRTEVERQWNELNGKVQSNTATDEEIRRYYDHRRQLSEDYIAFSSTVLAQYGEQLPDEERGLYELSIRMHRTRLEEIPARMEEAFARKRVQDSRREAWLKEGGGP